MTETTDKRQLTILIKGILAKYGIDNLACEMVLIDSMHTYIVDRKAGKNIAEIRTDIMQALEISEEKKTKNDMMESRIFKATGLYVNERWYIDGVIDFLLKKEGSGETIEIFAERCKADPFKMPKFFKIAEKPSYLIDVWGLAFVPAPKNEDTPADRAIRNLGI